MSPRFCRAPSKTTWPDAASPPKRPRWLGSTALRVPEAQPPAHLLPQMTAALGVSADVLLGLDTPRSPKRIATNRLERRLLEIDKLDAKTKRQITQLLDSLIEGEKLKRKLARA
jgi:hypothetical protein